jgi:hypothetical protein
MGASAAFAEAVASIMIKTDPTADARRLRRRILEFMATPQMSPTEPIAKIAEPS